MTTIEPGVPASRHPTWFPPRYLHRGKVPVPSVTNVTRAMGVTRVPEVPEEVLREAGDRGHRVHAAVALLLQGKQPKLPGTVKASEVGYVRSWMLWAEVANPEPVLTEAKFICTDPYPHGMTPDFAGWAFGRRGVWDWKTRPLADGDGFQVAAYRRGVALRSKKFREWARAELGALQLRKSGGFPRQRRYDPEEYEERWLWLLDLWKWRFDRQL